MERLLAAVDDLHRAVRVQREDGGVDLHRDILSAAEGATYACKVDANSLGGKAEARRDLRTVDVEPLGGDVDVDPSLTVGHREPRLGPEKGLVLGAGLVDPLDGHLGARLRVAVADQDRADDVRPRVVAVPVALRRPVGVELGLLGRALHVGHRLERLVVDTDLLGRPARELGVVGGDERDGLAEVADAVDRKHGLVVELEPVALGSRDVGVREHGVDARHRDRLRDVDLDDPCVSMRASDRVAPEHARRAEIARVGELALHLRRAVDPPGAVADPARAELARFECRRRHAGLPPFGRSTKPAPIA